MMQLFGGFGDAAFEAYDEAFPLADGWRDASSGTSCRRCWCTPSCSAASYGRAAMDVLVSSLTTTTDTRIDSTITADGAA